MAYIHLYCERLAPGLLGEPVNTLTNLVFFAAAWLVWHRTAQAGAWRNRGRLLAGLIALIGAGSFTFHAVATTWAEWLDELPILLFQLVFLWCYGRDVLGFRRVVAGLGLVVFLALVVQAGRYPALLNGSLAYFPALLVLLGIGAYHGLTQWAGARLFLAAGGVFVVSVFFRSIDMAVCPSFTLGTHFLWHLLNAAVLGLSALGLLDNVMEEERKLGLIPDEVRT
ncbi:ceramidase domain-containing protein [Crenobacter sp. SG2305]|uniref:ceramidase domain-containing protein n=1 Tax=Crenobacter oryzisoli TaxID=3056844 RepID=UPI0025AAF133|nr:ceramidase domain-containing protein [Crenobacter sp. SG2305]MDN0085198.1 ceramidase domain-containing protein [Crenobacter sp. SG2305]